MYIFVAMASNVNTFDNAHIIPPVPLSSRCLSTNRNSRNTPRQFAISIPPT